MLKHFRIYVKFEREETASVHFLSVEEITIRAVTEHGDSQIMMNEAYSFINTMYPDRRVASVSVYAH